MYHRLRSHKRTLFTIALILTFLMTLAPSVGAAPDTVSAVNITQPTNAAKAIVKAGSTFDPHANQMTEEEWVGRRGIRGAQDGAKAPLDRGPIAIMGSQYGADPECPGQLAQGGQVRKLHFRNQPVIQTPIHRRRLGGLVRQLKGFCIL